MEPRYDLDLTKYAFRHQRGDITVYGTWFGKDQQPALVLVQSGTEERGFVVPCVVPLASAWLWSDQIGDPAHCARQSYWFAHALRLTANNIATCMRITTLIRDHIGDLASIPVKPTESIVVADALRTDQYGKTQHAEVREDV